MKARGYEIARNCIYDGYQKALPIMVFKVFDKKAEIGLSVNEQLVEELHKLITKKFKGRNICARSKDNI